MKIKYSNLLDACLRLGLDKESADKIWSELEKENSSKFNIENLAYYFGALIIMSAMGWFMTDAWDSVGGLGISFLGIIYSTIFLLVGRHLWFKKNLTIPGGLLITIGIWMVPLIIFGIEKYTGLWPQDDQVSFQDYHVWIRGSWIIMEIATIVAGLIAIRYIRFPFLSFPIAFSLWYLSLDLTPLLFGSAEFSWYQKQLVSVYFGLIMLIFSYFLDRKTKEDFSFWGYLFGMLIFWGGISSLAMNDDSELIKVIYCLINLFFILLSVVIQRRVFIIFGSIGVFSYLGHLAFKVFEDSLLFPIALSLLGVVIIYIGIIYNRNKTKIDKAIRDLLPAFLLKLNPENRNI